jgi:hypothetical protein
MFVYMILTNFFYGGKPPSTPTYGIKGRAPTALF